MHRFLEYSPSAGGLQGVRLKLAVLALGLWLASAQGFAAIACCAEMDSPKAACDGCADQSSGKTSPRPDCCTSLEAQDDLDLAVPRSEVPQLPVLVALLSEDVSANPWRPETTDRIVERAAFLAEGPPLFLRYEVLLI